MVEGYGCFFSMSLVCNFGGLGNLKFWEKVQYLVAQQFPAPVICFGCKYPIHISIQQFPAQIHHIHYHGGQERRHAYPKRTGGCCAYTCGCVMASRADNYNLVQYCRRVSFARATASRRHARTRHPTPSRYARAGYNGYG